jgi:hypothetical protein
MAMTRTEGQVIDRSQAPDAHVTRQPASRRIFRSKVDTIRPTYGFEDVSLAPGADTIEPADVDLAQTFCGIDLAIPILASAMDAVADTRLAGELARLGGLAILNLEASGALRRPRCGPERSRQPVDEVRALAEVATADPRGLIPRTTGPSMRPGGSGRRHAGVRASSPFLPSTGPFRSSQVSSAPSPPSTTRCRSPSSPATCPSRSRSATRPTPRRPSR